MAGLLNEFVRVTQALNAGSCDYAVCGGWAMAIHGFLRATTDIALLIMSEDIDRGLEIVAELGFDIKGLPLSFDNGSTEIRRVSKIDDESKELITLDFLLVTEFLKDVWISRQRVEWDKGEYYVVSRQGMIKMKQVAARPKDMIDLEFLKDIENAS